MPRDNWSPAAPEDEYASPCAMSSQVPAARDIDGPSYQVFAVVMVTSDESMALSLERESALYKLSLCHLLSLLRYCKRSRSAGDEILASVSPANDVEPPAGN